VTATAAPAPAPIEFGALFAQSWELFKRNWIVSLPPIIAGFLATIIMAAFAVALVVGAIASHGAGHGWVSFGWFAVAGGLVLFGLVALLALWSQIAMYAMADAAWTRGSTTFDDGFAAFSSRAGAVLVAWIGIIGVAILAFVLLLPTLGLSLIALTFVTMYALPAATVGRRGGFEAIGQSFSLIGRFFVPSLITWLVLYAIQYGLSILLIPAFMPLNFFSMMSNGAQTLPQVPPLPLLAFSGFGGAVYVLALWAYIGFAAIVRVGLYRDLIAQPELPPRVQPSPPPSAV
jgi:hypothetical protein